MSRRHKRPADPTGHGRTPEAVTSRVSRAGDGAGWQGLEEVISLVSGSRQGVDELLRVAEECRSLMRVATTMPSVVELHACVDAALQAGIRAFNLESPHELEVFSAAGAAASRPAPLALRLGHAHAVPC